VVILSDSLSALQAIQSGKSHARPKLLSSLLQKYTVLAQRGYRIQLCWIPSHVGIPGNEGADKLARISLSQPNPQTSLPHSTQEIKSHIREIVEQKWNDQWQSNKHARWLHSLTPNVPIKTTAKVRLSRRSEVVIHRLRLGVTRVSRSRCTTCNTALDVKHLLTQCPTYQQERALLQESVDAGLPGLAAILNIANEAARIKLQDFLDTTGLIDLL